MIKWLANLPEGVQLLIAVGAFVAAILLVLYQFPDDGSEFPEDDWDW